MRLDCALRVPRRDFTLEFRQTLDWLGIVAVMGVSGSGKSTLLRALAGLEPAARGRIVLDGEILADERRRCPPHRRGIGYVFPDARLFGHRSVRGNLRFALARARPGADAPGEAEVVAALDLGPLLARAPAGLSGGERQRVAIGRALLANPRLLLLDEPLAALDAARRRELLPYIRALPARFGIPLLYVSHAVEEVAQLAGEVLILHAGTVTARGPVYEVLERPEAEAVSGAFEGGVVLDVRVRRQRPEYALTEVELAGQQLSLPRVAAAPGETLRVRVRARDVAVALGPVEASSIRNQLRAQVLQLTAEPNGPHAEVLLDLGGPHLRARITRESADRLALCPGQTVWALLKSVSFDPR